MKITFDTEEKISDEAFEALITLMRCTRAVTLGSLPKTEDSDATGKVTVKTLPTILMNTLLKNRGQCLTVEALFKLEFGTSWGSFRITPRARKKIIQDFHSLAEARTDIGWTYDSTKTASYNADVE